MSSIVSLTQAEHEQLSGLVRRATRPVAPAQAGVADQERASAVMLASLRVVLGATIAAELAGQQWQVQVVSGESVPDADRVIPGAVLLFHHARAGWMLLGDEGGRLHLLDGQEPTAGLAEPRLVDGAGELAAELAASAPGGALASEAGARALQLRPYRVRGMAMAFAFDGATGTWYRSRRIAAVTTAPAPAAAEG